MVALTASVHIPLVAFMPHISGDKLNEIAQEASTIIISRVRRRFMTQENPDGSRWPVSKAAQLRAAGKYTKGSDGGKHTGGFTLFCSGRIFNSIQQLQVGLGQYTVKTDVPEAVYIHNSSNPVMGGRFIMGVNQEDLDLVNAAISKYIKKLSKP